MGRKQPFGRPRKKRWRSKKITRAEVNPTNPPASSEHSPPEDSQKDPPHPTSISKEPPASPEYSPPEDNPKDPPHPTKEPNPSINLDSGSKFGLDVSANSVDDCCNTTNNRMKTSIRNLPTCTQLSTIVATPKKTAEETNMSQLPSSTRQMSSHLSTPQNRRSTFLTSTTISRPVSVINATRSCSSSISSMTTSPSSHVTSLNRIIDEQSKISEGKDTDDLNILRRLAEVEKQRVEVEKQREEVLLLVKKNANIRSLLTNNNIMLADYADVMVLPENEEITRESGTSFTRNKAKRNIMLEDYTDAKSFPSNEETTRGSIGTSVSRNKAKTSHANTLARREADSRESKDQNSSIHEVKRKRKMGAVMSIIETIEGEKGDDVQAKVLKQVLQHKSMREIVHRTGFIDSASREYVTMSNMIGSAKRFLTMASKTQSSHGRSNDDKRSAVETLQVAMVETPDGDPNTPSPSRERPKAKTSL